MPGDDHQVYKLPSSEFGTPQPHVVVTNGPATLAAVTTYYVEQNPGVSGHLWLSQQNKVSKGLQQLSPPPPPNKPGRYCGVASGLCLNTDCLHGWHRIACLRSRLRHAMAPGLMPVFGPNLKAGTLWAAASQSFVRLLLLCLVS